MLLQTYESFVIGLTIVTCDLRTFLPCPTYTPNHSHSHPHSSETRFLLIVPCVLLCVLSHHHHVPLFFLFFVVSFLCASPSSFPSFSHPSPFSPLYFFLSFFLSFFPISSFLPHPLNHSTFNTTSIHFIRSPSPFPILDPTSHTFTRTH